MIRRISTVFLVLAVPALAQAPEPFVVDRDTLYRMLAVELTEVLSASEQLTPLPPTLTGVYASPQHVPCFAFSREDYYARDSFTELLEQIAVEQNGFRLLPEACVVGWGERGEIAVADQTRTHWAICGVEGCRPIELPKGTRLDRALMCGGQWVYQTPIGVLRDGRQRPWRGPEEIPQNALIVTDPEYVAVVSVLPGGRRGRGGSRSVCISLGHGDDWQHLTYARPPFAPIAGLVRRADGRFLAIGSKLVLLEEDMKIAPTEADLLAALTAARTGDLDRLSALAAELSRYPTDTVAGLAALLQDLPELPNSERRAEPVGQTSASSAPQPAGPSPAMIGRLLASGYQWYDGCWIQQIGLLAQDTLADAWLWGQFFDVAVGRSGTGIFRLDGQGRLQLVNSDPACSDLRSAGAVRNARGEVLLFSKTRGLGRLDAAGVAWIDGSDRIKRMDKLIGCDSAGRLYFQRNRHLGEATVNQFWVYDTEGRVGERQEVPAYPTTGAAVVDDMGRLWFVHTGAARSDSASPNLATSPELKDARPLNLAGKSDTPPPAIGSRGGRSSRATLCRRDPDGACYQFSLNLNLSDCAIQPGRFGSVLLRTRGGFTVIHNETAYEAADLAELVKEHFGLLMELAPTQTTAYTGSGRYNPLPGICWLVVNDILWVAGDDKIEAYRDGRPLHIDDRVALLGVKKQRPVLLGPFRLNGEAAVMISCDPGRLDQTVWAVPGALGVALHRAVQPNDRQTGGALENPANAAGPPVIDYQAACLYYHQGFDRVWRVSGPDRFEMITGAGAPVLIGPDGRLLVRRAARVYPGYRWVGPGGAQDLAATYVKSLIPVLMGEDGAILCLTPEGIAWLQPEADAGYRIARVVSADFPGEPQTLLGRSEGVVYLLTDQRQVVVLSD
jgi:hypothetical protein